MLNMSKLKNYVIIAIIILNAIIIGRELTKADIEKDNGVSTEITTITEYEETADLIEHDEIPVETISLSKYEEEYTYNYSTALHLITLSDIGDNLIYYDKDTDLITYKTKKLEIAKGETCFIPQLGYLKIVEVTQGSFICEEVSLKEIYGGMSGTRVLSKDLQHVIGFISAVKEGRLIITRIDG